jgi:methyl-accepting chemotaxis protein
VKQLKLSSKIVVGFVFIFLTVACLLGFITLKVNTMRILSRNLGQELAPVLIDSRELTGSVAAALGHVSSYALSGRDDCLSRWEDSFNASASTGQRLLARLEGDDVLRDLRPSIAGVMSGLDELERDMAALSAAAGAHQAIMHDISRAGREGLALLTPLAAEGLAADDCAWRDALLAQTRLYLRLSLLWEAESRLSADILADWPEQLMEFPALEPAVQQALRDIFSRLDDLKQRLLDADAVRLGIQGRLKGEGETILGELKAFNETAGLIAEKMMLQNSRAGDYIFRSISLGLIMALALSLIQVALLWRGAVRPLEGVMDYFRQGAQEINQTAGHLSRSSRLLAKGVSDNTAAVLEAISNLEEMTAMAKRNAGHSAQAKELMHQAKGHVLGANQVMGEISGAMEEIRSSGQSSSQIIKTVEEIAFQTNILALNAAVEAARAGEAGLGFAVVADEVRNLANRSAEAAKNTAVIIAGSMDRINQGTALAHKAEESFGQLVSAADQVDEIVGEIAQASQSQAQGIQNIHQSIALVDKVTQENAAGAGETRSLSLNLTDQAAVLGEALTAMTSILKGPSRPARRRLRRKRGATGGGGPDQGDGFSLDDHIRTAPQPAPPPRPAANAGRKQELEAAIPMDDDF